MPEHGNGARARPLRPAPLIHKVDFEALMSAPVWSRSAHFAMHHLARRPKGWHEDLGHPPAGILSTDLVTTFSAAVDKDFTPPLWFGQVIPKRHARRAVTRALLKRQVREAFGRRSAALPEGMWLVRLRAGFAVAQFRSAASAALAEAARAELETLFRPLGPRARLCAPVGQPGRGQRKAAGQASGNEGGQAGAARKASAA